MIGKLISRPWSDSNSHTVTSPLKRPVTVPRGERCAVNLPAIPTRQKITIMGKYEVRSVWRGNSLDYEIFKNGLLYTVGFDRLSISEEMALEAIRERL